MRVLDKTLNAWQLGILMFVLLFANKILVLPSLLYEGAGFESIFIPVLLFLLEFGLVFLFYRLKTKFPNETFAQILKNHFGNVVKVIIFVIFMFFFLSKAVLLYNVTYIFFRNLIYKDYSNFLFLFCIIPIITHLAVCGLRVMGRTAQLFFPVIIVIIAFCIVVGFFGINSKPLLFEGSLSDFVLTTLKHVSSFGDSIFLFLIMDKAIVKKKQWKIVFGFSLISAILVVLVTVVFALSYTYTAFLHPYAIFEIMSYVKEYGGLGRIDIISMVVIIIFTYFHLAIYLKAFMLSFHEVFRKVNFVYPVITFNLIFLVVIDFFILNLEKAVVYGENVLPYIGIFPFVILPIAVGVLLLLKKRKPEKKDENYMKKSGVEVDETKKVQNSGGKKENLKMTDMNTENLNQVKAFSNENKKDKKFLRKVIGRRESETAN